MSKAADLGILEDIQRLRTARDEAYRQDLQAIDQLFETELAACQNRRLVSCEDMKTVIPALIAIVASLLLMLYRVFP